MLNKDRIWLFFWEILRISLICCIAYIAPLVNKNTNYFLANSDLLARYSQYLLHHQSYLPGKFIFFTKKYLSQKSLNKK